MAATNDNSSLSEAFSFLSVSSCEQIETIDGASSSGGNQENNATVINSAQINIDHASDVVIGPVVDIHTPVTIYQSVSSFSCTSSQNYKEVKEEETSDGADSTDLPDSPLTIISREEWSAKPPAQTLDGLQVPVSYVIIQHTATESCFDQETCSNHVRIIQNFHTDSRKWWDIGYNFLVGGDGNVYEGRGWTKLGAHTYGYNSKSVGIAFIGTFINIKPVEKQISAAKRLIELGVQKGFIAKDYKLLAARQISNTLSPGEEVYLDMKTWPHWVPKP